MKKKNLKLCQQTDTAKTGLDWSFGFSKAGLKFSFVFLGLQTEMLYENSKNSCKQITFRRVRPCRNERIPN